MIVRCTRISKYIVEKGCTVRQAAKVFGVSKSTVYKDITERVLQVNCKLARQVRTVLEKNKAERSIRGGMAIKQKYAKVRK